MEQKVKIIESNSVKGGIIGNLPAVVFQMSPVVTFQAFVSGTTVLVQMNNTIYKTNEQRNLTPSQPTASVPFRLYVGNGWMQLNDGVIDLELKMEKDRPKEVWVTACFDTCNSSTGYTFGTLGGTFVLPL